jgi:adenosine deaminase
LPPKVDVLALPKAELHVHIEGTLEPELIFEIGRRNGMPVSPPVSGTHDFENLQDFLDLYYAGMSVLRAERDYYEMAIAYLRKAASQSVRHAEIFFDPQAHTARGVAFDTVVEGLRAAMAEAERDLGISSLLILCFLRDLSEESAMVALDVALRNRDRIVAIGLDSAEVGNPPSKFARVFERARAEGFKTVAHAGEEGPPAYITQALDILKVVRVDHGVRCMEDAALVDRLRQARVPLTVCPLSNVKLRVVASLEMHPLKRMLDAGIVATLNSDDPAYFGGYIAENYAAAADALALSDDDLRTLAKNSFDAAFISDEKKEALKSVIDVSIS